MPILPLAAAMAMLLAPLPPATASPILATANGSSAATGLVAAPAAVSPRWRSPVRGQVTVVRAFDPPRTRWGSGHRGVDLAATAGSAVLAAGAGRVTFAGRLAGRGVISIEHAPGVRTTYEPVHALVSAGQRVERGEIIGRLAPDRRHPDSLHWGLRIRDIYGDPMRLLRSRPMLKPRTSAADSI